MSVKERLRQRTFSSLQHEAMLSIMVCSDTLIRTLEEVVAPFGITSAQYNVLRILRGVYPEGHSRREISSRMIQASPDVTRLIDRLEKNGFVSRTKGVEDKRQSVTVITKKGLATLEAIQPHLNAFESKLFSLVSDEEALAITKQCDKLLGSM